MTNFKNIIASIIGGGYGFVLSWELFFNTITSIIISVTVSVGSFIILHYLAEFLGWNKKHKK